MQKYHFHFIYLLILLLFALNFFWYQAQNSSNIDYPDDWKEKGINSPVVGAATPMVKIFQLPENLKFADEPVPLDEPDIMERFEREIYVNAYWHSNTLLLIKRSGKFLPTIESILAKNGIPDDFKYLAMIESGLMNVSSPAGAKGFWQFMQSTGKERGLEINNEVDERYHYVKATQAACEYLKKAYARFGNWTSVAASYNMGVSGLGRRKVEQKMPDYYSLLLNDETSRYVFRILAIKEIMENPGKYGFELQIEDMYTMPLLRKLEVNSTIEDLALWAQKHDSNYKILKIYNPWLRGNKLTVSKGNSYKIDLPA